MNIARVTPPFGTKMQSLNEFHLQPNSLLQGVYNITKGHHLV